jgi:hypothetical protein
MSKRQKYKDGEYIYLIWEDEPEEEYVRGHVDLETARNSILSEADPMIEDILDWECMEHTYARFSLDGRMDCDQVLRVENGPGRGRFKITRIPYLPSYRCAALKDRRLGPFVRVGNTVWHEDFVDKKGIMKKGAKAVDSAGTERPASECYASECQFLVTMRDKQTRTVPMSTREAESEAEK